jgi:hypothetical protein
MGWIRQGGEGFMKNHKDLLSFSKDMNAQYQLIKDAYETGDEAKFEQAILSVEDARRMLRSGILEMIQDDQQG